MVRGEGTGCLRATASYELTFCPNNTSLIKKTKQNPESPFLLQIISNETKNGSCFANEEAKAQIIKGRSWRAPEAGLKNQVRDRFTGHCFLVIEVLLALQSLGTGENTKGQSHHPCPPRTWGLVEQSGIAYKSTTEHSVRPEQHPYAPCVLHLGLLPTPFLSILI